MEVFILVGTTTGNAQFCAEAAQMELESAGASARVLPMDALDDGVFEREALFLIVCSTYGSGDVPDNARALLNALGRRRDNLPPGTLFGVASLGDSTFAQTFAFGGRAFEEALLELGAERVGSPLVHDASSGEMPERPVAAWALEWWGMARTAKAAQPRGGT